MNTSNAVILKAHIAVKKSLCKNALSFIVIGSNV